MNQSRGVVAVVAVALCAAAVMLPADAADQPDVTIVSTSGIPHHDVGYLPRAESWQPGMPIGRTQQWIRYMADAVDLVTADDPDVVVHGGDMVEGQWHRNVEGPLVFGPVDRDWQVRRSIRRAADVYYPWLTQWWDQWETDTGGDVLYAVGDHEVGDLTKNGPRNNTAKYRAYDEWKTAWTAEFGPARYSRRIGPVGIIVVDPVERWNQQVVANIGRQDREWMAARARRMRDRGARWVLAVSEVPAVGPNAPADGHGTSGLLLRDGAAVWDTLNSAGVDVLLAAEFHGDTTHSTDGAAPVQVVHGGSGTRLSWLTIDAYQDRLELTLREAVGSSTRPDQVWATTPRSRWAPADPQAGEPQVTGTATLWADGRLIDRTGALREGIQ